MSFRTRPGPRFEQEVPIDPPLVPSPYDDEFESDILDPSWSRIGSFDDVTPISPAASFTGTGARWSLNGLPAPNARPSWYMIQADPATNCTLRKPIAYPSEYFIWTRMSFRYLNAGQTNNDSNIRMGIVEPASFHYVDIALNESDGNTVQVEFSYNQGTPTTVAINNNVGGAGLTKGQVIHAVGIQCLSGTYHGWAMNAAGNWQWIGSQVYAGNTLTHVDLRHQTVTASDNAIGGFDFLRFKAGRHLP